MVFLWRYRRSDRVDLARNQRAPTCEEELCTSFCLVGLPVSGGRKVLVLLYIVLLGIKYEVKCFYLIDILSKYSNFREG